MINNKKFMEYKITNEIFCNSLSKINLSLISDLDEYFLPVLFHNKEWQLIIPIGKKNSLYYIYELYFSYTNSEININKDNSRVVCLASIKGLTKSYMLNDSDLKIILKDTVSE